jgi:hypothetical protein
MTGSVICLVNFMSLDINVEVSCGVRADRHTSWN